MIPVLNIIHLSIEMFTEPKLRTEATIREHNFKAQCFENKITYGIWTGVIDKDLPWRGISRAHKKIVQHAKDNGLSCCFLAEDDFLLKPGGWKVFTESMPDDFDIYLAGVSGGNVNEETKVVDTWSGMFLYCVHNRFYDAFLAADEMQNIDRWLSTADPAKSKSGLKIIEEMLGRKPVYKICYPMAAITRDGISFKSKEFVNHDKFFKAYQVLGS